tara:strand:- start:1337 stop:1558 length:222 start_codon:yes stop_codon:yes gene_type:complete
VALIHTVSGADTEFVADISGRLDVELAQVVEHIVVAPETVALRSFLPVEENGEAPAALRDPEPAQGKQATIDS